METSKIQRMVCVFDDSIDHAKAGEDGLRRYIASRKWEDIEPFIKPGSLPTVFHVRPVHGSLFDGYVMATDNSAERATRAFRCGVSKVENLRTASGELRSMVELAPSREDKGISDDAVYEVSAAARYEIGSYVEQSSFLVHPTDRKFTVPPSSVDAMTALGLLDAARSRPESPIQSSEKPSPNQEQETMSGTGDAA